MRAASAGLTLLVVALLAPAARAQDAPGRWSEGAIAVHARAERLHLRFVVARHDSTRIASQRACLDRVATRAGALTQVLEDRAALGGVSAGTLGDVGQQLDELEHVAREVCTRTSVRDGVVDVDVDRHPFSRRMPRDRAQLRLGIRYEAVPRVARGGYASVPSYALRGAFGGFVTEALRVEVTAGFTFLPPYGPSGSVGARALLTAPWSLLRIAVGLEAALVVAADRLGATQFGWLGVQLAIPVELAFEISEGFGLTITGGPVYTQAGEVRLDERAVGGAIGVSADIVL